MRETCDRAYWPGSLLVLMWCFSGCAFPLRTALTHTPPLRDNVPQLVAGRTTRDELLRWFGTPYIHADGAIATLNPREKKEGVVTARLPKSEIPYSSIDLDHEAFYYLEVKSTGFFILPGGGCMRIYRNRLLVFVDKKTGLVDEWNFREEFKAR